MHAVESVAAWLLGGTKTSDEQTSEEWHEQCGAVLASNQTPGDEAERVSVVYRLGATAAAGNARSLSQLLAALEPTAPAASRRVAVHGLGAAGTVAVPALLQLLENCTRDVVRGKNHGPEQWEHITNCADALGEAVTVVSATLSLTNRLATVISKLHTKVTADQTEKAVGAVKATVLAPAELWWEPCLEGALASCIVALGHVGQYGVASGDTSAAAYAVVETLLPIAMSGAGDLVRPGGFRSDLGRAVSRRGCVLACEAIRNLCWLLPLVKDSHVALDPALRTLAQSTKTSTRLRTVARDALSALASARGDDARIHNHIVAVDPFWRDQPRL